MKNENLGEVVRQIREGKGITQEKLCQGICSVSTLSRIENGWQNPSRSMFKHLFERMGEEGIVYDDYLGDYDYEIYNLVIRIMVLLDRGDNHAADRYLEKLRYAVGDGRYLEQKGECVYRFAELLTSSIEYSSECDNPDKETIEIYQYGHHLYEEIQKLFTACINLTDEENHMLDRIEIRMYNLMGYAKYLQKDYKNAIDIWIRLIEEYRRKDGEGIEYMKERASLYCNISAALSDLGMYDEAFTFASKGLRICFNGGSLRLVNRLLHNRMYCLKLKGDENRAYADLAFSKAICTSSRKDLLREEKILALPKTPYLIQIF